MEWGTRFLPGPELGNLTTPSREPDDTNQGTGVPPSLQEPSKEPPTPAVLTPAWVAQGESWQDHARRLNNERRGEEEQASDAGDEAAV